MYFLKNLLREYVSRLSKKTDTTFAVIDGFINKKIEKRLL
ncbi:hypothetical protein C240_655 [Enterococcus sp. 5H]|nr:hypothetical protein [Enterococcus sp. 5H]